MKSILQYVIGFFLLAILMLLAIGAGFVLGLSIDFISRMVTQ